jgi:hypothetical protein
MAISSYLLVIFSFVAGFGIGAIFGWEVTSDEINIDQTIFRRIVATVITVTWIVAIGADIGISSYDMPIALHGIMGATAGYLFSENGLDITIGS